MKIGILTLPLYANYGGNLQAYALMTILKKFGHEAWLIDPRNRIPVWFVPLRFIRRFFLKYIGCRNVSVTKAFDAHAMDFIAEHIRPKTERLRPNFQLKDQATRHSFDAIIVGSDQVWRTRYTTNIEDYFLGFLGNNKKCLRISYAASFGTDEQQFTPEQAKTCAALLKRFSAVSVRELSAVALCREYFGIEAVHVLDPTLLLDPQDYLQLVPNAVTAKPEAGRLFTYLLDHDPVKMEVLDKIVGQTGFSPFDVSGPVTKKSVQKPAVMPPVEKWIAGFRDAEFVFTDSFHGCVFSILFNKPFIAFGNLVRGLARFESLLNTFKLRSRLVGSVEEATSELINKPISWQESNLILAEMRKLSFDFLQNALTDK